MPYDTVVDKAKLERAITATADAIRAKTGDTAPLKWDAEKGLSDAVSNLSTGVEGGVDTSDATATAEDMAKGVTAYANGEKVTGSVDVVGNLVAVNFDGVTIAEKKRIYRYLRKCWFSKVVTQWRSCSHSCIQEQLW